jgi:CBS domain-containing protein
MAAGFPESSMTVAAAMKSGSDVVTVTPRHTVREVVKLIAERRIGAVPVMDGNHILGIISERDLLYWLHTNGGAVLDWTADQVMVSAAITVAPDTSGLAALSLITQHRVRHLPVVEGGHLVGIVSIGDLAKWQLDKIEQEAAAMRAYIEGDYEKHI